MPWKEETVENQRKNFVSEAIREGCNFSELCRRYGITRKTGYKWVERYMSGSGLTNQSTAPHFSPRKSSAETEDLILSVRIAHPSWGARKILRYLSDRGCKALPAPSTTTEILKRNGFVLPEESAAHTAFKRFERDQPNDLWQMDFKGHFAMLCGTRCHPLTMKDDHSRMLLCLDAYENERWPSVKHSLNRVFEEYGLPMSILCDNGPPWGDSHGGYTLFEVWMMQMDVLPIHGRPMHPQTQGKEERFHRTLNQDVIKRTALKDLVHAQEVFDAYRYEFNHERPHGALNLDVPAKHYRESIRRLPSEIKEPEYNCGVSLRKVNCKGYISIDRHRYFLGDSLVGKYMELVPCDDDQLSICYGNFIIAKLDLNDRMLVSKKIYRR